MDIEFDVAQCAAAALGGVLLAIASSLNLLLFGRITGISGLFFNILKRQELNWRLSMGMGIVFTGALNNFYRGPKKDQTAHQLSDLGFLLSGTLVGLGAKLANGCTSGHGVCGLPRFSKRSFAAIGLFMGLGMASSTFYGNQLSINFIPQKLKFQSNPIWTIGISTGIFGCLLIASLIKRDLRSARQALTSFGIGGLFSSGLMLSGMTSPQKVISFLKIGAGWNPSLAFVMGGAVIFNLISFNSILKKTKPLLNDQFKVPTPKGIDLQLILGAGLFGVGWGLGGICPGPALSNLSEGGMTGIWLAGLTGGMLAGERLQKLQYFKMKK